MFLSSFNYRHDSIFNIINKLFFLSFNYRHDSSFMKHVFNMIAKLLTLRHRYYRRRRVSTMFLSSYFNDICYRFLEFLLIKFLFFIYVFVFCCDELITRHVIFKF